VSCEALIASASWHARDRSTWPSLFRSPVDPEIAVPHGGLLASVPVLCVCVRRKRRRLKGGCGKGGLDCDQAGIGAKLAPVGLGVEIAQPVIRSPPSHHASPQLNLSYPVMQHQRGFHACRMHGSCLPFSLHSFTIGQVVPSRVQAPNPFPSRSAKTTASPNWS